MTPARTGSARSFDGTPPGAPSLADSPVYRLQGLLLRGLPKLPPAVSARLLREAQRHYLPRSSVRAHLTVAEEQRGGVRIVWLEPARRTTGVILYLHGGAYIFGPLDAQWQWLVELTRRTGFAAAAVIYRMPPDHPYPAALDDVTEAIARLSAAGDLPRDHWVLAGDSAGGGLAIAALRRLMARGHGAPAGLVLSSPWVDLALNRPEIDAAERSDKLLHRSWVCWAAHLYAAGAAFDDPELSPIHGSFDGFPPVHLDAGTRDMLLPDVRKLRQRLAESGVEVTYLEHWGGTHASPLRLDTAAGREASAAQAAWMLLRLAAHGTAA